MFELTWPRMMFCYCLVVGTRGGGGKCGARGNLLRVALGVDLVRVGVSFAIRWLGSFEVVVVWLSCGLGFDVAWGRLSCSARGSGWCEALLGLDVARGVSLLYGDVDLVSISRVGVSICDSVGEALGARHLRFGGRGVCGSVLAFRCYSVSGARDGSGCF